MRKKIDIETHDWVHKRLSNNWTLHVADNYLGRNAKDIDNKKSKVIHHYQIDGEQHWCSINLAAIIATYENNKYFEEKLKWIDSLGIEEFHIEDNHLFSENESERVKKIETIIKNEINKKRSIYDLLC